ncbi:NAD(P)H-binding protein [Algoriphagus persicinus]|uniref:NAD(P)H-binding protein n=1 Tax=Algoriphagus persicinus TaxID=3108754 RepID=UPI002B3B869D|nr:NAD(P)H-binding protein [Algoriphagus sp. E1-3-M2]MEB2783328.1 NAD(P)H-binding protein [Algoriphagus sp. E1-3-M2]
MTKISIIGLGWIGLPLAQLLQVKGHTVVGSTTSAEKQAKILGLGVEAIQFSLVPFPQGNGFQKLFTSEVLVINIPPRSRSTDGKFYLEQIKFLRSMVDQSAVKKVIFVSSTGVYPKENRKDAYTETENLDKYLPGNETIYHGELLFSKDRNYELTIVRFGGLLGDDRIPGKYIAGRENVVGHTRVNYIYRNDAARMLAWIIENDLWNEIYNGVAPIHSLRKKVYEQNVIDLGFEPPKSYQNAFEGDDRLVSGSKILSTGFEFEFPNPLDFPYSKEN